MYASGYDHGVLGLDCSATEEKNSEQIDDGSAKISDTQKLGSGQTARELDGDNFKA